MLSLSIPLPVAGIANRSQNSVKPVSHLRILFILGNHNQSVRVGIHLKSVAVYALSQPSHYAQEKRETQRQIEFVWAYLEDQGESQD